MKIAITGSNGRIGQRIVLSALKAGHTVLGLDSSSEEPLLASDYLEYLRRSESKINSNFSFRKVDLRDFDEVLSALQGCDAVIALAACPDPTDYRVLTHNR